MEETTDTFDLVVIDFTDEPLKGLGQPREPGKWSQLVQPPEFCCGCPSECLWSKYILIISWFPVVMANPFSLATLKGRMSLHQKCWRTYGVGENYVFSLREGSPRIPKITGNVNVQKQIPLC